MFSRTERNVGFLAWAAGAVLTLGVAVGASAVVPQLINSEEEPAAVTSAQVDAAVGVQPETAAAPAPVAEVPIIEETIVPEVETAVTTAPRKVATPRADVVTPVVEAPAPAPAPAPVPTVPARILAARTVPSDAQVQSVISTIKSQVPLLALVSISPGQVADIGNQVCTAFDQGKSFAEVKAVGLAQVPAIVTIPAATADYAVRNAVAMYCPGYASKLV